jgi:hypothetical protein
MSRPMTAGRSGSSSTRARLGSKNHPIGFTHRFTPGRFKRARSLCGSPAAAQKITKNHKKALDCAAGHAVQGFLSSLKCPGLKGRIGSQDSKWGKARKIDLARIDLARIDLARIGLEKIV